MKILRTQSQILTLSLTDSRTHFPFATKNLPSNTRMQMTNSVSGGRVGKKIRRALPAYIACIIFFLLLTQIDHHHFERYQRTSSDVLKRVLAYQSTFRNKGAKFPKKIWQTWKVDP